MDSAAALASIEAFVAALPPPMAHPKPAAPPLPNGGRILQVRDDAIPTAADRTSTTAAAAAIPAPVFSTHSRAESPWSAADGCPPLLDEETVDSFRREFGRLAERLEQFRVVRLRAAWVLAGGRMAARAGTVADNAVSGGAWRSASTASFATLRSSTSRRASAVVSPAVSARDIRRLLRLRRAAIALLSLPIESNGGYVGDGPAHWIATSNNDDSRADGDDDDSVERRSSFVVRAPSSASVVPRRRSSSAGVLGEGHASYGITTTADRYHGRLVARAWLKWAKWRHASLQWATATLNRRYPRGDNSRRRAGFRDVAAPTPLQLVGECWCMWRTQLQSRREKLQRVAWPAAAWWMAYVAVRRDVRSIVARFVTGLRMRNKARHELSRWKRAIWFERLRRRFSDNLRKKIRDRHRVAIATKLGFDLAAACTRQAVVAAQPSSQSASSVNSSSRTTGQNNSLIVALPSSFNAVDRATGAADDGASGGDSVWSAASAILRRFVGGALQTAVVGLVEAEWRLRDWRREQRTARDEEARAFRLAVMTASFTQFAAAAGKKLGETNKKKGFKHANQGMAHVTVDRSNAQQGPSPHTGGVAPVARIAERRVASPAHPRSNSPADSTGPPRLLLHAAMAVPPSSLLPSTHLTRTTSATSNSSSGSFATSTRFLHLPDGDDDFRDGRASTSPPLSTQLRINQADICRQLRLQRAAVSTWYRGLALRRAARLWATSVRVAVVRCWKVQLARRRARHRLGARCWLHWMRRFISSVKAERVVLSMRQNPDDFEHYVPRRDDAERRLLFEAKKRLSSFTSPRGASHNGSVASTQSANGSVVGLGYATDERGVTAAVVDPSIRWALDSSRQGGTSPRGDRRGVPNTPSPALVDSSSLDYSDIRSSIEEANNTGVARSTIRRCFWAWLFAWRRRQHNRIARDAYADRLCRPRWEAWHARWVTCQHERWYSRVRRPELAKRDVLQRWVMRTLARSSRLRLEAACAEFRRSVAARNVWRRWVGRMGRRRQRRTASHPGSEGASEGTDVEAAPEGNDPAIANDGGAPHYDGGPIAAN